MLKRLGSSTLLVGVGVLFSMSLAILAPLPLMVLRKSHGRAFFWVLGLAATAGLYAFLAPVYAVVFGVALVLSGVFNECEEFGLGYSTAVALAVVSSALVLAASVGWNVYAYGFDPIAFLREQITNILAWVELPAGVTIDKENILRQVPSGIFICFILATWVNSLLARRFEMGHEVKVKVSSLRDWKMPDAFVWVALASTAGTFLVTEPASVKWAATNVFNVVILLYFFQGLAVTAHFLETKQVSSFWRSLVYVMAFLQLFLFVALIGFVDLWIDFRRKMKTDKSALA